jgi:hypothetical protein
VDNQVDFSLFNIGRQVQHPNWISDRLPSEKAEKQRDPAWEGTRASRPMPHSFCSNWPEQNLKGPFGVRRLVAALEIVFWPGTGSLLPFSGKTNSWLQAHRGNPGSKLPVWGSTRLLKAATSRRTPNAPWVPCVKNYAVLGVPSAKWHGG